MNKLAKYESHDLILLLDEIANAACEAVDFSPGETKYHNFDFILSDDLFIEGRIKCQSDWADHTGDGYNEPFDCVARGCEAVIENITSYGFDISNDVYQSLMIYIDAALSDHVSLNYPD